MRWMSLDAWALTQVAREHEHPAMRVEAVAEPVTVSVKAREDLTTSWSNGPSLSFEGFEEFLALRYRFAFD